MLCTNEYKGLWFYTIANTVSFLSGIDPSGITYTVSKMRDHLAARLVGIPASWGRGPGRGGSMYINNCNCVCTYINNWQLCVYAGPSARPTQIIGNGLRSVRAPAELVGTAPRPRRPGALTAKKEAPVSRLVHIRSA